MQKVLTLESNKYSIKLDNFQGPLDLLCTLIEKNKMNIYDINLNEITDQYISYINKMEELNLEVTSEFLTMASTLLYIKSKKLLPNKQEEEDEITEEELIRRIVEYKKYKDIQAKLMQNFKAYSNRIFKLPENIISRCLRDSFLCSGLVGICTVRDENNECRNVHRLFSSVSIQNFCHNRGIASAAEMVFFRQNNFLNISLKVIRRDRLKLLENIVEPVEFKFGIVVKAHSHRENSFENVLNSAVFVHSRH